jgi:hypothetical protein
MAPSTDLYIDKQTKQSVSGTPDAAAIASATTDAIQIVANVIKTISAALMGSWSAGIAVGYVGVTNYAYTNRSTTRLINTYFKTSDLGDMQELVTVFRHVSTELNLTTTYLVDKTTPASVYGETDSNLYDIAGDLRIGKTTIGLGFFQDTPESQPGTIIHEAMHRMNYGSFKYARDEKYSFDLLDSAADWDAQTNQTLSKWCDTYAAFAMGVADRNYLQTWGGLGRTVQMAQRVGLYNDMGTRIFEAQQRLRALGLYTGPVDGDSNPEFAKAMAHFSRTFGHNYVETDWSSDWLLNQLRKAGQPNPVSP